MILVDIYDCDCLWIGGQITVEYIVIEFDKSWVCVCWKIATNVIHKEDLIL